MAFRQFDIALGEDKVAVDVATSASALLAGATSLGGVGARVMIDANVVQTSVEASRQLEVLRQYIIERPWPPGTDIGNAWILGTGRWYDNGLWIENEPWKDA